MTKLPMRALVVGLLIALASSRARAQVNVNVSIGGFYDELAPYGRWVDCTYGQCWVPGGISADWQPYTNGQWVYTAYGWTWVSNDPWGASPYHYGSWTPIPGYGWGWVPGTVWAPAWVTWSYNASYVGWAPLPPSVVIGGGGYAGSAVVLSPTQYVFVPTNHFAGANVSTVRVSTRQSETIFHQTTPVTRFSVTGGIVRNTAIPIETIQRAGGGRIETRDISFAKTAPRPFTVPAGGGARPVAAPASEIKAALSGRPQAHSAPVAKADERGPAPKPHENRAHPARPNHEAAPPPAAHHRSPADAPPPAQKHRAPAPEPGAAAAKHPSEQASPPTKHAREPMAAAPPHGHAAPHPAEPAKPPAPNPNGKDKNKEDKPPGR